MAPPSDPPKRYEQLSPWILKRRKLAWKDGRWIGANGFKDRLVAQKREDWDEQELRECINFILVTKEIDPANPPPEIVAIQQKQISQPDTQNIPTGPRADRQRASSSVAPSSSAGARSDFGGDNDSVTTSKHAGSSQPALSGRKARRAAQANGGTQSLAGEQSGPDPRPEWDDAGSPALDWATLNGNSIANDANGLAQLAGGNLGGGIWGDPGGADWATTNTANAGADPWAQGGVPPPAPWAQAAVPPPAPWGQEDNSAAGDSWALPNNDSWATSQPSNAAGGSDWVKPVTSGADWAKPANTSPGNIWAQTSSPEADGWGKPAAGGSHGWPAAPQTPSRDLSVPSTSPWAPPPMSPVAPIAPFANSFAPRPTVPTAPAVNRAPPASAAPPANSKAPPAGAAPPAASGVPAAANGRPVKFGRGFHANRTPTVDRAPAANGAPFQPSQRRKNKASGAPAPQKSFPDPPPPSWKPKHAPTPVTRTPLPLRTGPRPPPPPIPADIKLLVSDDSDDDSYFDELEYALDLDDPTEPPSLDDQIELLGLDDPDDDDPTARGLLRFSDNEIKNSVLFSPRLFAGEDGAAAREHLPQYSLVGSVLKSSLLDTRIFLNTNIPASFFVCGLQGSGKSHTLSTLLESYLIPSRRIGILQKPVSGLVLHFGEYNSKTAFRPCEAAFLASPDLSGATVSGGPGAAADAATAGPRVRSVTVLVSPSNYHNLKAAYSQIPRVKVYPLKLRAHDLTVSTMLTLMSVDQSESAPLYMAQVTKVLRDMAATGADFDYIEFGSRLDELELLPSQRRMLNQRLDLLESFLELDSVDSAGWFTGRPGHLTIVDLSCPFVDAGAACVLFGICIGLYLSESRPDVGKIIAVDEAHKYMTDTPASRTLTDQLLSIIRQQRHFGARIIIATQEPTISPRLMDLASVTIIHRFNSPEWFNTLRKHLSIVSSGGKDAADLFERIVSLRVGEALVFAPSALLIDETPLLKGQASSSAATTLVADLWDAPIGPENGAWDLSASMASEVPKLGSLPLEIDQNELPIKKMNAEFFKVKVRRRITADGGRSVVCL